MNWFLFQATIASKMREKWNLLSLWFKRSVGYDAFGNIDSLKCWVKTAYSLGCDIITEVFYISFTTCDWQSCMPHKLFIQQWRLAVQFLSTWNTLFWCCLTFIDFTDMNLFNWFSRCLALSVHSLRLWIYFRSSFWSQWVELVVLNGPENIVVWY